MADAFTIFDTRIGRCGIAWNERGIAGVQLPEVRDSETRARLRRRFPTASETTLPPPTVRQAIDGMVALLRGDRADLSGIALDMSGVPPFHRRVYEAARRIAPGATLSYGEVAARVGSPGSARAVGQALGRNPFAIVVPCHRVLAAGGRVGGFSANGGVTTKLRMLGIEGARTDRTLPYLDDARPTFDADAALRHLRAADPKLAQLIERVGPFGMKLDRAPSLFRALAEAIVYQQLTGKAAATIFARVCALFPRAHEGPTPQQIMKVSDEKLRAAGLSRAKLLALRDLAERTLAGELPTLAQLDGMADEEIIERLTPVRGIGRWTVEMLLMFRLGRPDVLPADDYGVRKGFAIAFNKRKLPDKKGLLAHGKRWAPYRTAASWYLWRATELVKR